jgi:hypothetical protein
LADIFTPLFIDKEMWFCDALKDLPYAITLKTENENISMRHPGVPSEILSSNRSWIEITES